MPFRDVLIGPRGRHTFLRHASLTPPFAIQENDMSRSMLHLCKEEATVLLHHFFFFLLLIFLPFGITFFTLSTPKTLIILEDKLCVLCFEVTSSAIIDF